MIILTQSYACMYACMHGCMSVWMDACMYVFRRIRGHSKQVVPRSSNSEHLGAVVLGVRLRELSPDIERVMLQLGLVQSCSLSSW